MRWIVVKRLDDGQERTLRGSGFDDIQPAWSPDGLRLLFVRGQKPGVKLEPGDVFGQYDGGDLWDVELLGGRETRRLENAFNPAWSPDGRQIAVDASWAGPRRLWVVDSEGRNPQQASSDVSEAVGHLRPRWSPDGARLVFQNIERTKFDIRVADLANKRLLWVTNDIARDIDPEWSPDGRFIYFSCDRGGGFNMWRVPVLASGEPRGPLQQLTTGAGQDVELALSRDGSRLAFSILKQNADLWRLPVDATGRPAGTPESLVATTREESRGSWSPDGQSVAFNSDRAGEMNLWVHSVGSGEDRPLTSGPGETTSRPGPPTAARSSSSRPGRATPTSGAWMSLRGSSASSPAALPSTSTPASRRTGRISPTNRTKRGGSRSGS